MTHALLVAGPESSGTRFLTKLLIACGAHGSHGHAQPFDSHLPPAGDTPIVWRRSMPHAHRWPNLLQYHKNLVHAGYTPYLVGITRNWPCSVRSQHRHHHVSTDGEAIYNIQTALFAILSLMTVADGWLVHYDYLIQEPYMALEPILKAIPALKLPEYDLHREVVDGNMKYRR